MNNHEMRKLRIQMESERLSFRRMTQENFEDIKAMLADPDVMYAWEKTFDDQEIREWIERQKNATGRKGWDTSLPWIRRAAR